ncbi:MAG: hypothetical protein QOJ97_858 [Solirubrobacteraceae bacterium]|jgi:deazaflavin-dependent oxidoreductase (nitroreductase family)|nr:hypothetical protein [Solirubrobacteraceae bacterium]
MSEDPNPFDGELFGAEHVRVYRETGGERGYRWRGTTILLLTTVGRSSGEERTTPLIYRDDGERWVVVASKGGAPRNPSWYENLRAQPDATIQVRSEEIPVRASTAEGAEREPAEHAGRARGLELPRHHSPPSARRTDRLASKRSCVVSLRRRRALDRQWQAPRDSP